MAIKVPSRQIEQFRRSVPKFQQILRSAKDRDVNESDTVTIIGDILEEVFGFDKYTEITREYVVRGTHCDLATLVDGRLAYLVEVKAVGIALKDSHLRQAVDYGAKEGLRWVVLTNGIEWRTHGISWEDRLTHEEVCRFNFLEINPRNPSDQELLYLLCRRGVAKDLIGAYYDHRQACNRFVIAALLQHDEVLRSLRRMLRRMNPGVSIDLEQVRDIIVNDLLKREVVESDEAKAAISRTRRSLRKPLGRRACHRNANPRLAGAKLLQATTFGHLPQQAPTT